MFCDASPIWPFLSALGATEDPEASKTATDGLHLVETYPAAALPTLATKSFGADAHPTAYFSLLCSARPRATV
jgi:hypothetical protein